MLEWLGEKYADTKCINAAAAIEQAAIKTLQSGITVPDLGGKASTMEMAQAIAAQL
jgi:isocitrate/isopropylmalate dehydrogenase